jgi:cellulose synthase/poly-beta-1,6-N-acetylglucosamine synthase-like glycosyltransferase
MTSFTILEICCFTIAVVVAIPMMVLAIESMAALLTRRAAARPSAMARPGCAIIVPAHNEEAGIAATLQGLRNQVRPGDRLIVVADNCDDRTAEIARSGGAVVLERHDSTRRGKGFALAHAVQSLAADPPAVVVFVDADCRLDEGSVDHLVATAALHRCPVQAANLTPAPPGANSTGRLSSFAFWVKNYLRPTGLAALHGPCLLTGTGMAIPWEVLRGARLASGNIVEDLQLGIDLAVAGHPARFCRQAVVRSDLPSSSHAAATQRQRWAHGHLRTLFTQVPRLLVAAVRQRRLSLLALALELGVPPLSMLFLVWVLAGIGCALLGYLGGSWVPAAILAVSGGAALAGILAGWFRFGRDILPLRSMLAAPLYAVGKAPLYISFFFRPQRGWIRTERTASPQSAQELSSSTGASTESGQGEAPRPVGAADRTIG